jgi:hypothetical protein
VSLNGIEGPRLAEKEFRFVKIRGQLNRPETGIPDSEIEPTDTVSKMSEGQAEFGRFYRIFHSIILLSLGLQYGTRLLNGFVQTNLRTAVTDFH